MNATYGPCVLGWRSPGLEDTPRQANLPTGGIEQVASPPSSAKGGLMSSRNSMRTVSKVCRCSILVEQLIFIVIFGPLHPYWGEELGEGTAQ
jgi:hypothetical protein